MIFYWPTRVAIKNKEISPGYLSEFEQSNILNPLLINLIKENNSNLYVSFLLLIYEVGWQSGYAFACRNC